MSAIPAVASPPDPIFELSARYKADKSSMKADLGIGAYRSNDGVPWVLPVVHKTEQLLANDPQTNHEYLPLEGLAEFRTAAAKLIFGTSADISRIATVQTLSGTGANHMAALLLARFTPFSAGSKRVWLPTPTWGNHQQIFGWAGHEIKSYPYWDGKARRLNFEALVATLRNDTKRGDTVLLHACAHNPTGMDPTREQWQEIAAIIKEKQLFAFFDCAYQGFASGDLDRDAWAVRYFIEQKIDLLVCQSFSKNMGLYGERCGAIHVVLADATPESVKNISSQIATQTRAEVSNCPAFGARIAAKILTSPELFAQWKHEVQTMASRIIEMRHVLRKKLEDLRTPGTWSHITEQIGMFSFTGLTPEQSKRMVDEYHVYMLPNGRASMAGLNSHNIDHVAKSIHAVVTGNQQRL